MQRTLVRCTRAGVARMHPRRKGGRPPSCTLVCKHKTACRLAGRARRSYGLRARPNGGLLASEALALRASAGYGVRVNLFARPSAQVCEHHRSSTDMR